MVPLLSLTVTVVGQLDLLGGGKIRVGHTELYIAHAAGGGHILGIGDQAAAAAQGKTADGCAGIIVGVLVKFYRGDHFYGGGFVCLVVLRQSNAIDGQECAVDGRIV